MDWSSFWPDMLVAALTTGAIAALVLFAERRISNRAARRATFNAQAHAVDQAALLLERDFVYERRELAPDTKSLKKLRRIIRQVPSGVPLRHVPGYRYAEGVANADAALRIRIEAIMGHVQRYAVKPDVMEYLAEGVFLDHVTRIAKTPNAPWTWERQHTDVVFGLLSLRELEHDADVREDIDAYLIQRRLLHANREAFFKTHREGRMLEWAASIPFGEKNPRGLRRLWMERKSRKSVAQAKRRSEAEALELIQSISPY